MLLLRGNQSHACQSVASNPACGLYVPCRPKPDGSALRAADEVRLSALVLGAVVPSLLFLLAAG